MKKIVLFSLAAALLLWIGCNQQHADVSSMLKNAESKDKVFTAILDDHEMMMELMNKMMSNDHAKMMMMNNQDMMKMMMSNESMFNVISQDEKATQGMMKSMISNHKMMEKMMSMMVEKGMMTEECHAQCMEEMKNMPMDMSKDSMKNQHSNHETHH